ncbi:MAG: hypothetical protein OGMRLDGQ_000213 [Candidatus Fervidibacter sp.]
MNWEGDAPAEPKRQRVANSEWRVANGFSGGHGSAVPKNFGRAGTKLEGCSTEQPNLFKFRSCGSTTLQLKPKRQRVASGE